MLTLISKKNLSFTKPKCNCGLSVNKIRNNRNKKNKYRKLKTKKN